MEQNEIPMLKKAVIAQHFIAPHNDTDLSCHHKHHKHHKHQLKIVYCVELNTKI